MHGERAAVSVKSSPLLALESPFPEEHSMLRFLEPPGTSADSLWDRLFDGSYRKPFIIDSGMRRSLHFDFDAAQSVMDMTRPDRLCLTYTRKMMSFLLFNPVPKRILMLGLGGGSLAKFCYRHLTATAVTVIEVNPDVLLLRREFGIPADDDRFRVVRDEGSTYVRDLPSCKDIILADACNHEGLAPELSDPEFYRNAWRSLAPGGVFVTNICGDEFSRAAHLLRIRQAFGDDGLTLPVRSTRNAIVIAFKDGRPTRSLQCLIRTARGLKRALGLDFPKYVRKFAIEWQRPAQPRSFP
jgi:spermidine synthase